MTQFGLVLLPGWPERSTKSHEIARTHNQFSFVCFRGSFYLARQSLLIGHHIPTASLVFDDQVLYYQWVAPFPNSLLRN